MITRKQAKEAVEAVGRKYEQLSYAELERLMTAHDGSLPEGIQQIGGSEVHFCPEISEYDLRRRIAVEVLMYADGMEKWPVGYGHYFEMFPSGKLRRFGKWVDVLLIAFLGVGLLGIVWFAYDVISAFMRR